MTTLDLPLLQPAEILASEEVLLDAAETGICGETLAFWEATQHFIVLGYGNKVATEVNQPACERLGIPILRRISGGGTVLQGPGVLNYTLILRATEGTPLATINWANQFIMQRNAEALTQLLVCSSGRESAPSDSLPNRSLSRLTSAATVEVQGHTDLAIAGRKFSGNAQRRKRTHLLFHGATLLNLDLALLDQALPLPSLQPDYREGRSHRDFLTQLAIPVASVKQALRQAWSATQTASIDSLVKKWRESVERLVADKYSRADWNLRV
jgi:lipoate-protein ligase A